MKVTRIAVFLGAVILGLDTQWPVEGGSVYSLRLISLRHRQQIKCPGAAVCKLVILGCIVPYIWSPRSFDRQDVYVTVKNAYSSRNNTPHELPVENETPLWRLEQSADCGHSCARKYNGWIRHSAYRRSGDVCGILSHAGGVPLLIWRGVWWGY